jgi:Domain of unknown function (DUF4360)
MFAFSHRAIVALAFFVSASVFAEGTVEWSNLNAAGNGCPAGSAVITATPDGNELAWTSSSFGYELQGESSVSRFCRLNASAAISPGYYLDEIRQQVSYGGLKTKAGSVLSIGAQTRFLGFTLDPISREYADGSAFARKRVTIIRRQKFETLASHEYFCDQEARRGLFQGAVASSALVSTPEGKVSMGIQGLTVAYKVRFSWLPCPQ